MNMLSNETSIYFYFLVTYLTELCGLVAASFNCSKVCKEGKTVLRLLSLLVSTDFVVLWSSAHEIL